MRDLDCRWRAGRPRPGSANWGTEQLEQELRQVPAAETVRSPGGRDARRGGVFQPHLACSKCLRGGCEAENLGADLAALGKDVGNESLVEAVLWPSKGRPQGF